MVVLVHHALLTTPSLADVQRYGPRTATGWERTFVVPPLHLVWAGSEAVLVFFVLSGLVLTLSMDRDVYGWRAYYVRRTTRLYLPVWGAVLVAAALAIVFQWRSEPELGWWLSSHVDPVHWHAVRWDSTLVTGTDWLDSPLWSLRWEVWFSLLLPVYLLVARPARRAWLLLAVGLALLIVYGGRSGHQSLLYLPIFGFGVLLGVNRESALRRAARVPRAGWWLLLVVSLACLEARWIRLTASSSYALTLSALGAAGIVGIVAYAPGAAWLGNSGALRWLGRVSFSLYLVHEPVLVSVAQLSLPQPASVFLIGVPLALLATVAFHRWVEVPAQRLATLLGRRFAREPAGRAAGSAEPAPPSAAEVTRSG